MEQNFDRDGFIVYDNHVAFWGSEFSNFHKCKFTYLGIEFKSSEQAFMYEKALYFKDKETADLILKAKTPKDAKALGRQVKGFNSEQWSEVCEDIMYNVVLAKFCQNEYLARLITRRDLLDKTFVEGSKYDFIWGCGIEWNNPIIDDENKWKGKNLLGKVLCRVRDFLLKNY